MLLREIVGLVIFTAIGVSLLALFVAALRHCRQPDADENARTASWVFGLAFAAWLIVLAGYILIEYVLPPIHGGVWF